MIYRLRFETLDALRGGFYSVVEQNNAIRIIVGNCVYGGSSNFEGFSNYWLFKKVDLVLGFRVLNPVENAVFCQ